MNKYAINILVVIGLTIGCSTTKKLQSSLEKDVNRRHFFTGIVVYDLENDKTMININGSKYFIPASNTKLFTFYTAWKSLKDSVPAYEYGFSNDSLYIRGSADPGFLKDSLNEGYLEKLRSSKTSVFLVDSHIDDKAYGEGWAWDDYPYAYMPERHIFPVYGNTVLFTQVADSVVSDPSFFNSHIEKRSQYRVNRAIGRNVFYVPPSADGLDQKIPFKTSNQLVADLLSNELGKKVTLVDPKKTRHLSFREINRTVYDSLYTHMLVNSDNFIAEQLMLQVGYKVDSSYNVQRAIEYSLRHYLSDIPQLPQWVDGSGLSRYNLFTPESIIYLLKKMIIEIPPEKLFSYFPKGGESGTLKQHYQGQPYVIAKSGTLSNNYCLSGYVLTKKGNTLLFSYMNNHYQGTSAERKKEMASLFYELYQNY